MSPVTRYSLFISCCFMVSVILFTGCGSKEKKIQAGGNPKATAPPAPKVDAYIVKTTSVSEDLDLPGTLVANEATEIHPEISGRMTYLNAAEGKMVGKGTLIAKIYDGDLRAQLNKLSVQLRVQEQTAKRYEELLKINGVSQQEYDMIVLQSGNIRADMQIVQSNITRTEIRAPFSGTLGLRMVSPGAYITPQTILTTIRQNNELKLDFTLPEKFISQLRPGQIVNFTSEGNPKTYNAKVTATESGVSEDNRSLQVRAIVVNNDRKLLPGTFAKVKIGFEPDPNAIMIPSQAIIPQARGKQVAVYNNGEVAFVDVLTGIRDSARVQITNGLKVGDTIITTGLMSLKPKAKVSLNKVKSEK
ncbi:MAG: efflux RND transporter periplasmic adaptor subunit [Ferruginibacter sp.]